MRNFQGTLVCVKGSVAIDSAADVSPFVYAVPEQLQLRQSVREEGYLGCQQRRGVSN